MTRDDINRLVDACYDRERENFKLAEVLAEALRRQPNPAAMAPFADFLMEVGIQIWNRGFEQGFGVGMEMAEELNRDMMRESDE